MSQFPPSDEDRPDDEPRVPPKFSDAEVDDAFSGIAAQYERDSLIGPRDYIPAPDEEPFIPPDPGPVTSTDPFLTMGWFLLGGGLGVILLSLMFWPSAPRVFHLGCAAAALVGAAILVWRMPHHKDEDDDLGAVV